MNKSTLLLLAGLSFITSSVFAQNASVSGYVTDRENGETLLLANVVIEGTSIGAATNNSGYYSITGLKPGEYVIYCSYLGFQAFRKTVILGDGEKLRLDIELEPESTSLEELVVVSKREQEELKNIGVASVSTQLIKKLPSVFEADVFRSVQLLPGVKSSNDFSAGLYVRGGGPDQTLILLDRTTVYNPSHFFGFFSTFNPDAIKDVRLYKGGYPAEYGGRLGAVLDIYNKDGNRYRRDATATIGLLASRIAVESPYERGSVMLAFRRSTIEPVLSVLSQTTDNIPTKFYFFDLNGKINFDLNENNKFTMSAYGGRDRVIFPFADDGEFGLGYGNRTFSTNWTHLFNPSLFSNFTVTWSRYFNQPTALFGGTTLKRDNNIYDFSLKGDLEYLIRQEHALEFGFWAGNMLLRLDDEFDEQPTLSNRIQTLYSSVYVQETWTPNVRWKILSGLRANYFNEGEYLRLEPRLNIEYKASSKIRLQLAYGRYYQFLTLITNDSFSAFDVWLTTDEGVPPAFGDQYIAGIKVLDFFRRGLNLDLEVYYRSMNDLFELDPQVQDVAGFDYPSLFRFGEGYAYGVEMQLEKTIGRINGFVAYNFAVTRRKFPGFNAPIAIDQGQARFYPPRFDLRNEVNVVFNYDLSRKWRATALFNYATGQAYTEPQGQWVAQDNPTGSSEQWILVTQNLNGARLPAYHRADIGFTRLGTLFKTWDTELQLQIINVYNRRNVWFYNWEFSDNQAEKSEVVQLPILPNISFTINF